MAQGQLWIMAVFFIVHTSLLASPLGEKTIEAPIGLDLPSFTVTTTSSELLRPALSVAVNRKVYTPGNISTTEATADEAVESKRTSAGGPSIWLHTSFIMKPFVAVALPVRVIKLLGNKSVVSLPARTIGPI